MKFTVLTLFCFCSFQFSMAQKGFGLGFGFSTKGSINGDIKYYLKKNAFSIGGTYEINGALGKGVTERLSNYGTTEVGSGEYFYTVDFGYTRLIKRIEFTGEASVGSVIEYTNYEDNRFTEGGYHLVNSTRSIVGVGIFVTYFANKQIGFSGGFNTIRGASLGLHLKFVK